MGDMEGTTAGVRPRKEMSTTDLAHSILKSRGKAMHYRDLIEEILKEKEVDADQRGRVIAQIHTEINLDSRFLHKGQGQWALREWSYKGGRVVTVRPERPSPKPRPARLFPEDEEGTEGDGEREREREEEPEYSREPEGEESDEEDWE